MEPININGEWIDPETGEVVSPEEPLQLLRVPVTLYRNFKDAVGCGEVLLSDFLTNPDYEQPVTALRQFIREAGSLAEAKKSTTYKRMKASLPCVTVSGLFSKRRRDCIIQHSGFICIDIDKGDNLSLSNIDTAIQTLMCRPEVAFIAHSCSGQGLFAIIPLANPEYHLQHFWALQQDYARLGLTIDRSCKDTTRFRAASYDPDYYYNALAEPYTRILLEEPTQGVLRPTAEIQRTPRTQSARGQYGGAKRIYRSELSDSDRMERLVLAIEARGVNLTEKYDDWFRCGMALADAFGEAGYDFFRRISQQSGKFREDDCRRKYNELLRGSGYTVHLATVYHMAAQAGIDLSALARGQ